MLAILKKLMSWLYILPAEKTLSTKWKIFHGLSVFIDVAINISYVAANLAYILKLKSSDLEGSLFAFLIICYFTCTIYVLTIAIFRRQKMGAIFEMLSKIYESSK